MIKVGSLDKHRKLGEKKRREQEEGNYREVLEKMKTKDGGQG